MPLPAEGIKIVLLALALVLAHSVETTLGFGATIIALALGLFLFPLQMLLPVLVTIGILQSTWLAAMWIGGQANVQSLELAALVLPGFIEGVAIGSLIKVRATAFKTMT